MHPNFDESGLEIVEKEGDSIQVKRFNDEGRMLQDFVNFVDVLDPDCILAWGMGFYDLPTLYRRLESTEVGAHSLVPSSIGRKETNEAPQDTKVFNIDGTEQPIPGRIVISLDKLYERIYRDSKSTNLPSMKLDVVGQTLFGRGKTEFRPGHDENYDKFIEDYLYYNYIDVKLMVEIEASCNAVEGQQN